MTLLDEFNDLLGDEEGATPDDVDFDGVEQVSDEYQDSGRWSEQWTAVFKRGDEYVALDYEVPATEMQEGGDFYSQAYAVVPEVVTITKYRKV